MQEQGPQDAQQPRGHRPTPPGTLRLGTVAGVEVLVRYSWLLIAVLIAVLLAPRVDAVQPGLGSLRYVAGLVFAVLLYLSVLLHEISHAVVAQHYGLGVRSITLHFLGGATEITSETRSPRQEFAVAVVGPLTSLAVGGVALLLLQVSPGGLIGLAVEGLAGANLVVGVLNLVPGLPLDGGRLLRAAVWQVTGSLHRGTLAAGWVGRAAAFAAFAYPFVRSGLAGSRPALFDVGMAFVVATFLWSGATAAIVQARVRRRLPALQARPLARRVVAVAGDLPLSEAVGRAQEAGAGGILVHDGTDRLSGVVSESALVAIPEERRAWIPVSSVARSLEPGLVLDADVAGERLVAAMASTPAEEYVLLEADGTVYGLLSTADVEEAFARTAPSRRNP